MEDFERAYKCILGGAIGDSFGADIEFMSYDDIEKKFGLFGVDDLIPAYGKVGHITDDTQMALFTAQGLVDWRFSSSSIYSVSEIVHAHYILWHLTQKGRSNLIPQAFNVVEKHLLGNPELWHLRAPGGTCLSSLGGAFTLGEGPIENRVISSNGISFSSQPSFGAGGVMRSAPVGIFYKNHPEHAYKIGVELAKLTHLHPGGWFPAGIFSKIIASLMTEDYTEDNEAFKEVVLQMIYDHKDDIQEEEDKFSSQILEYALEVSDHFLTPWEIEEELGGGWAGDEALAIALYSVFYNDNYEDAIKMAVNHSGDSDTVGAITGNIAALLYSDELPERWVKNIELKDVMKELSIDLVK